MNSFTQFGVSTAMARTDPIVELASPSTRVFEQRLLIGLPKRPTPPRSPTHRHQPHGEEGEGGGFGDGRHKGAGNGLRKNPVYDPMRVGVNDD